MMVKGQNTLHNFFLFSKLIFSVDMIEIVEDIELSTMQQLYFVLKEIFQKCID